MDTQVIMQMMQPFLPSESRGVMDAFREVTELQQMILSHANRGGEAWQLDMLIAIRPCLPERNQHMVDILIKCMELSALLNKMKGAC